MVSVYLIDSVTRLHLPDTAWSRRALLEFRRRGHKIEILDQPSHPDTRTQDETRRVDELLDSITL